MKTKRFTKLLGTLLSFALMLTIVLALLPTATQAAGYLPTVTITSSGTHFFYGNGTTLYVDEGTSGGTCVWYEWSGSVYYLNQSGAAGDDLSSSVIWGTNTFSGISTSVVVKGGSIGSIYGGSSSSAYSVSSTSIAILDGTVRNVTLGGNGNVNHDVTFIMTGGTVTGSVNMYGNDGSVCYGGHYLFKSGGSANIQNAFSRVVKLSDGNWTSNGGRVPAGYTMDVEAGKTATIEGTLFVYGDLIVNGTVYNYGLALDADDVTSGTGKVLNLTNVTAAVSGNTITFTADSGYLLPDAESVTVTTMDGTTVSGWTLSGSTLTLPSSVSSTGAIITASNGTAAATVTTSAGVATSYATLAEAVSAAQASSGSTLKLNKNCTLGTTIEITSGDFTLDLNGFTISNATDTALEVFSSTLVIQDSGTGGTIRGYTNRNSDPHGGGLYISSGANVTLKSGTITSNGNSYSAGVVSMGGTFTVTGGEVTHDSSSPAIYASTGGTVNIQGGKIGTYINALAVTLNVSDGELTQLYLRGGKVNVSGGTITAGSYNSAIHLPSGSSAKLTVTGGTIIGASGKYSLLQESGTVTLSGGTFQNGIKTTSSTLNALLADGFCYRSSSTNARVDYADTATLVSSSIYVDKTNLNADGAEISLALPEGGYVYSGTAKEPAVTVTLGTTTLTEGTHYEVAYTSNTDAGTATVTVTGIDSCTGTLTDTFPIASYPVTADDLEFVDGSVFTKTYDGTAICETATAQIKAGTFGNTDPIAVTGTAAYDSKDVLAATTVTFTPNAVTSGNWTIAADQTVSHSASITPKNLTIEGVQVADKTYDGNRAAAITNSGGLVGLVEADDVTIDISNATATFSDKHVGTDKTVTLSGFAITGSDASNYSLAAQPAAVTADIAVKSLTVKNVVISDKQYDGKTDAAITSAELDGAVAGDDVALDLVNSTAVFAQTATGEDIPVACVFAVQGTDKDNYDFDGSVNSTADIYNTFVPVQGTEYTVNSNDWQCTNFTVRPAEGYEVSLGNLDDERWSTSITVTQQTGVDGNTLEFYVRNKATGAISQMVAETYKMDKSAPTGTIAIGGSSWDTFSSTDVCIYLKEDQTLTVTASDALSGVASIELYVSESQLTLAEVESLEDSNWEAASEKAIPAVDGAQYFCYARITDNVGFTTYLASDGIVFDLTPPAISGVSDGQVSYTTLKAAVTDENLDTVTLNTVDVTADAAAVELTGDQAMTYTLTATDKSGNKTTVNVTMKPIEDLAAMLEDVTVANVNLDHKLLIDVVEAILDAQDTTNATGEELEALEAIRQKCHALIKQLNDMRDAINTDAVAEALDITKDNVTLEDEEVLEQAKEDLEAALENYENNLRVQDVEEIEAVLQQIEEALEVIENVQAVQDAIDALPETADPDDEKAIAAQEAAKKAYDALTEYEKAMVDTTKLDKLTAALTAYKLTKGDGSTWTKESGKDLSFTANGAYSKFVSLSIDGKTVDAANYTAASGSTVITLKASYLETLGVGKHTISVVYPDGSANGTFTVEKAPTNGTATTGDTTNLTLLVVALLASVMGIVTTVSVKGKKW